MVFNSVDFLLFFPAVCFLYYVLPIKVRYLWLLAASYYFCVCWGIKFAGWLFATTVITYLCGRVLDNVKNLKTEKSKIIKYKKICLVCGITISLSMLFFFKYFNFFGQAIEGVLNKISIKVVVPKVSVLLPVGMSFYIFQGIGYLIDIYREEIAAEKNFFKYALYLSFFPRLISGPIERSKNLLEQIQQPVKFDVEKIRRGLLTFAWGLFLKLAVADRIANVINPVFDNYGDYHAMSYLVVVVMYAFQVYFDFEGYSLMAIGSAGILGYGLKSNFASPYFSSSIQEFWRRWHISLTSWFRDYLYIPLGGNRKGKVRKHLNTMIVFLTSGLWHGAGWNFIIWGGLNGFYIVFQDLTKKWREKVYEKFGIDTNGVLFKCCAGLVTFLLVDFAWLFFRVETFGKVADMLGMMIKNVEVGKFFEIAFWGEIVTAENLVLITVLVACAFGVDYLRYKNIDVVGYVFKQPWIVRWMLYYALLFTIVFLGAYGEGYEQTQFIYFQF
ncbi:MAG: MBOAT family protein [Lachnospiraceae bacterium]|nr:MBOAT family protein [Lachnospiraceae bacterium]